MIAESIKIWLINNNKDTAYLADKLCLNETILKNKIINRIWQQKDLNRLKNLGIKII